ncbi:MAG: phosphate signaling complex protein PhoU [Spirochaetia bacterium]
MKRHHLTHAIDSLHEELLKMGAMVEEILRNGLESLVNKDIALAEKTIEDDEPINQMEVKLEDMVAKIIATEQPVATDLRHLITTLKIVASLERMGDHGRHLAKAAIKLKEEEYIKPLVDIPKMTNIAIEMIHNVLSIYIEGDVEKAKELAKRDDEIDTLHRGVIRELLILMEKNRDVIEQATRLLFISRFIERLGDHVTNICEWIVFDNSGKHIELNE